MGLALAGVTVVRMVQANPVAPPPRPLATLPEIENASERCSGMHDLTGVRMPPGWRLIAASDTAPETGEPASVRSWTFMLVDQAPEARSAAAGSLRGLAPKGGGPAGLGLAESLAIEAGRFSIGSVQEAWTAVSWKAPAGVAATGKNSTVGLDVVVTDQAALARVRWVGGN